MIPRLTKYVRIGNKAVNARTIHTVHDVDHPVGTGDLTLKLPLPREVDLDAPVEVYLGRDGLVKPVFSGQVSHVNRSFDLSGGVARIDLEGHGRKLRFASHEDHGVQGPVRLDRYYRAVAAWRGVPLVTADVAYAPDGSQIMLGSNPEVIGGMVTLPAGRKPEDQLSKLLGAFGYRHFDTPQGPHHMQMISGMPQQSVSGMVQYREGENVRSITRGETLRNTYNYIVVKGAQYRAADTSERAIRSIPQSVVTDPRFGPEGISEYTVGPIDELVTLALAQASRNAYEMDLGGEYYRWSWRARGDADRRLGEPVALWSPRLLSVQNGTLTEDLIANLPVPVWLMRIEHTANDNGWVTDMEGWAGYGTERPAGEDSVFFNLVGSAGLHLGNEWLGHYRRPMWDGLQIDIPFAVPEDYSTLTIRGIAHGVNSFIGNTQSEVSRFEVWQTHVNPDRSVASGDMPRFDENLELQIPYGETSGGVYTNRGWGDLVIPLTGAIKADPTGATTFLRVISELDRDVGDYDDFEIANVVLEAQGAGVPIFI